MELKIFVATLALFLNLSFCLSDRSSPVRKLRFSEEKYDPPSYKEKAKRARYLLRHVEWAAIATISSHYNKGVSPFSNVAAITDGPPNNSTGTPYMYLTDLDTSVQDTMHNPNMSLTVSEMETSYCKDRHFNAESPPCARLTMVGKFERVTSPDEKNFALNALFTRFPAMRTWPMQHSFFPAKLNIEWIWLIDIYGGASIIPPDEYFSTQP